MIFDILFDQFLRMAHELERELVRLESVILPAWYAIRDSESTLRNEVGVFALVLFLSDAIGSWYQDELCFRFLFVLLVVSNEREGRQVVLLYFVTWRLALGISFHHRIGWKKSKVSVSKQNRWAYLCWGWIDGLINIGRIWCFLHKF